MQCLQDLVNNKLNLPPAEVLRYDESDDRRPMPYFLVADEAFGIRPHVMRPFSMAPDESKERVFNYRLSRARRVVECSFGILANRFVVWNTLFHSATLTCCFVKFFFVFFGFLKNIKFYKTCVYKVRSYLFFFFFPK